MPMVVREGSSAGTRRNALPPLHRGAHGAGGGPPSSEGASTPARSLGGLSTNPSFRGTAAGGGGRGGGGGGAGAPHGAGWAPHRPSAPATRQSYRSGLRQSASSRGSRTREAGDGSAPIKVLDIDGTVRTPKALIGAVPLAALRHAKGLLSDDTATAGDAGAEGYVQLLSSANFSRGWFDSGVTTPVGGEQSAATIGGRGGAPAVPGSKALDLLPSVDARTGAPLSAGTRRGTRKTRTSAEAVPAAAAAPGAPGGAVAAAAAAALAARAAAEARPLSDAELSQVVGVVLSETDTITLLELPGLAVAIDGAEGEAVAADARAYASKVAARDASGRTAHSEAQTPAPLRKHREAQAGGSSRGDAGCQASGWDIADTYASLGKRDEPEEEDPLLGAGVLPMGGAAAAGGLAAGTLSRPGGGSVTSSVRGSAVNFAAAGQVGYGGFSAAGGGGRAALPSGGFPGGLGAALGAEGAAGGQGGRDSLATGQWGAGASSTFMGWGGSQATIGSSATAPGGAAGLAAPLSAAAGPNGAPEAAALNSLPGLGDALALVEAALSVGRHLPQLLQYRNIQVAAPTVSEPPGSAPPHASGGGSLASSRRAPPDVVPPTPSGALRRSAAASVATTPGGGGGPAGNVGGTASASHHGGEGLSRLSSAASALGDDVLMRGLSTGVSLRSLGSSRALLRGAQRPPAQLQLLWTWSCALTEGLMVTGLAWNRANPDLLAAGYSSPSETVAGGGAPGTAGAMSGAGQAAGSGAGGGTPGPSGAGGATSSAAGAAGATGSSIGAGPAISSGAGAGGAIGSGGSTQPTATAGQQPQERPKGLVALWSVRNLSFPCLTLETKSGVASLDFSTRNPSRLAVGLRDGTLAVYDVRPGGGGPGGSPSSGRPGRGPGGALAAVARPLMASTVANGRHADPVWQVRWLDRGPEREELLVTVSTDGRLAQWSTEKGLEHTPLMTLRRVPHRIGGGSLPPLQRAQPAASEAGGAATGDGSGGQQQQSATGSHTGAGGSGLAAAQPVGQQQTKQQAQQLLGAKQQQQQQQQQQPQPPPPQQQQQQRGDKAAAAPFSAAISGRDAVISRSTGGMSFAFSPRDPSVYLAGTEDGWIHRCSTSYSGQYLESYRGHLGPVHMLAWCPMRPDLFLSASADWTLRLWQEGRPGGPLLTFQSGNDEVLGAAWCPGAATAFGSVTAGGRLEVWDLAVSTLQPVARHVSARARMTALAFGPAGAPVVVAGSDGGGLLVFRHTGVVPEGTDAAADTQLAHLEEALRVNAIKGPPNSEKPSAAAGGAPVAVG